MQSDAKRSTFEVCEPNLMKIYSQVIFEYYKQSKVRLFNLKLVIVSEM